MPTQDPPEITAEAVCDLQARQRAYFASGATRPLSARRAAMQRLLDAVQERQADIAAALASDLGKPLFEAYTAEICFVVGELKEAISKLSAWARPRAVWPNLVSLPGSAAIYADPLGVVLIIGPWNYPFQLLIAPLIGALAAGNCAVLKPSELTPATSALVGELVAGLFAPEHVACVLGGIETGQRLLDAPWDHVFFTGSTPVGRIVMQAAARHLTPVTLELGGKSPCIVDKDADLESAAKRIVWGKFSNAGQTCIAPDYVWVQESVKPALVHLLRKNLEAAYGEDPQTSPDYARIVSPRHAARLSRLLEGAHVLHGGKVAPELRYVEPTLVDDVDWNHPLMQEEIFGPVLPILTFASLDSVLAELSGKAKPLALYYFSRSRAQQDRVLSHSTSGGVCINDVTLHFSVPDLPFGGVGESGTGAYHGRRSFETFSHMKSVLRRATWGDPPLRYAPFTDGALKIIKMLFGVR